MLVVSFFLLCFFKRRIFLFNPRGNGGGRVYDGKGGLLECVCKTALKANEHANSARPAKLWYHLPLVSTVVIFFLARLKDSLLPRLSLSIDLEEPVFA